MLVFTEPMTSGASAGRPAPERAAPALAPRSDRRATCRCRAPRRSRRRRGVDAGVGERRADHRLLRRAVRHGQPAAAAVLVDRRCRGSPRGPGRRRATRRRSRLSTTHAAALAAHEAVGARVERLAAAVGRQHARLATTRSSSRASSITFTPPASAMRHSPRAQALAREVHRDERRRARGVDRQRRPLQPEAVRRCRPAATLCALPDARYASMRVASPRCISRAVSRRCCRCRRTRRSRVPASDPAAMPACSSASHATSSSSRCCGSIVSASRGEMPKNAASKLSDASRNPPLRDRHPAGRIGVGVEVRVDVPAIGRHLADRVAPSREQRPRTRPDRRRRREPAAHADDGDRRVARWFGCLEPAPAARARAAPAASATAC